MMMNEVEKALKEEGRATIAMIAVKLGKSRQSVYSALVRLCAAGKARRVGRGLYEWAGE